MSRTLRFLHITTFYPPYHFGGDAIYVYRLTRALADAGHRVDVIHCIDSYNLLRRNMQPLRGSFPSHPGIRVFSLHSGLGSLSPLLSHQSGQPWLKRGQIARALAGQHYDVMHYHNISLFGPGILKLTPPAGPAVKVYTAHEHWLVCPMHVLWKFDRRPCERPQCVRCMLWGRRPPQLWRYSSLMEQACREVDQFLAPSRFTARMHAERGFKAPMTHLPLFTEEPENGCRDDFGGRHPRPYFLFVGRLERIKGLDSLIAIWERVPEADLLIAGDGSQGSALRSAAGRNARIRFLGNVAPAALDRLYSNALACIIPSVGYEVFAVVGIEAFARKVPLIVRDLGPLPELIEESNGGFIYRTDDELLSAIRNIAQSERLRSELGANGYLTFKRRWSPRVHLEMYFGLLETIALRKFGHVPWDEDNAAEGRLAERFECTQ